MSDDASESSTLSEEVQVMKCTVGVAEDTFVGEFGVAERRFRFGVVERGFGVAGRGFGVVGREFGAGGRGSRMAELMVSEGGINRSGSVSCAESLTGPDGIEVMDV